jgi:hypothetical protein
MLLVEPERPAILPATPMEWLDRQLGRICVLSELTATQYRNAENKYRAVGEWLALTGSPLAPYWPEIYPQGSMAHGTTVRPYNSLNEYDLDLVCQLHYCGHEDPLLIYERVYDRLADHETYRQMLERMKRCLRLNCAGAFHLDILPACPNGDLGSGAILVPDCKLECWKHSNPKGLTGWFLLACQRREAIQERLFKASIEPLPSPVPSEFKFPLQRVVQLMKRHRDIFFAGGRDIARSVILTTLAGNCYRGERSLSRALASILDTIHAQLAFHAHVPVIANPVHPGENFADTWDQEKYDRFRAYIANFRTQFASVLRLQESSVRKGMEASTDPLGKLFGSERVKEAIRMEAGEINERRERGSLSVTTAGLLAARSTPASIPVARTQFYGR